MLQGKELYTKVPDFFNKNFLSGEFLVLKTPKLSGIQN
jgi:hypothetical protein